LPNDPKEGSNDDRLLLPVDEALDWDRFRLGVTSSSSSDTGAGADWREYPFEFPLANDLADALDLARGRVSVDALGLVC
jgi:hypothetical protein